MCNDSIARSRRFGWRSVTDEEEGGYSGGERVLAPFSVSADLTEKLISQLVVRSKAWLDQHVRARFMCHISHTHTHTHPTTYTIHICMCVVLLGNH